MVLRTMRGSLPSTTLRSPYRVSPKIQTERPSGNGIEYTASAPHQDSLKGKLGLQSIADFSCARSAAAQENRNNAIMIGLTQRLLEPQRDICDNSFRRRLPPALNQCSARGRGERKEDKPSRGWGVVDRNHEDPAKYSA